MEKTRSCFFTGHRKISKEKQILIKQKTKEYAEKLIVEYDVKNFICGGAIGFDTIAAEAVLELKELYPHIMLWIYVPCRGQSDLWDKRAKEKYSLILSMADEVVLVSNGEYCAENMRKRNLKMIKDAFFCIAFCLMNRSGTGFTLRNAEASGCRIFNIADDLYQ